MPPQTEARETTNELGLGLLLAWRHAGLESCLRRVPRTLRFLVSYKPLAPSKVKREREA